MEAFTDDERKCDGCGATAIAQKCEHDGKVHIRWDETDERSKGFKFCRRNVDMDLVSRTTKTLYFDFCKECLADPKTGYSQLTLTEAESLENERYLFIYSNTIAQTLISMGYDIEDSIWVADESIKHNADIEMAVEAMIHLIDLRSQNL